MKQNDLAILLQEAESTTLKAEARATAHVETVGVSPGTPQVPRKYPASTRQVPDKYPASTPQVLAVLEKR